MNTSVLIVGGGPTGLLSAYLLSRIGVPCIVAERHPRRLGAPKAHALSPRSLEICRQAGLSVEEIRSFGSPRADARHVRFVQNLCSETEVGSLPYERMDLAVLDETPEMLHNIPQPDLEDLLHEKLKAMPNVRVVKGLSWESCEEVEGAVVSQLKERGSEDVKTIRSKYVIACDGAKSTVRRFFNIEMEGEDSYERLVTIQISAPLKNIIGNRPGLLHWIMDPAARGFIIAYRMGDDKTPGNQVLIHNPGPDADVEALAKDAMTCRSIVQAAIGSNEMPFELLGAMPWILSRKVARHYRLGNVFLAGDAAHAFPPTGGLGLNSGIADAHNIVVKIGMVESGWAAPTLFDRYEAERRPVALVNSQQSVKNGLKIFALLRELEVDQGDMSRARKQLEEKILDPETRSRLDILIEEQREHFDNLNLHIGYIYGDPLPPSHASYFYPKVVRGARLPHAWIQACNGSLPFDVANPVWLSYLEDPICQTTAWRDCRQYSTLDLIAMDRLTIIAAKDSSVARQLSQVLETRNVPVHHVQHGLHFTFCPDEHGDKSRAEEYARRFQLDVGGGIVVRPDQHIACLIRPGNDLDSVLRLLAQDLS